MKIINRNSPGIDKNSELFPKPECYFCSSQTRAADSNLLLWGERCDAEAEDDGRQLFLGETSCADRRYAQAAELGMKDGLEANATSPFTPLWGEKDLGYCLNMELLDVSRCCLS
jgi:hypothetical protein